MNDDDDDDEQRNGISDNHQLKSIKTTNGNGINNLNNHENDDSDSQIEFEQTQLHSSKI